MRQMCIHLRPRPDRTEIDEEWVLQLRAVLYEFRGHACDGRARLVLDDAAVLLPLSTATTKQALRAVRAVCSGRAMVHVLDDEDTFD